MASVLAVQPARHDVAWYRVHANERASVLAICQNDHSFDDAADCRNANSAAQATAFDNIKSSSKGDPEADPAYYEHDTGMIAMILSMCSHNGAPAAWCQAAQVARDKLKH